MKRSRVFASSSTSRVERELYYVSLVQRSLIVSYFSTLGVAHVGSKRIYFIEGVGSGSSNLGSVSYCPSATRGSLIGPPGLNIEMSPCVNRTATPLRGA